MRRAPSDAPPPRYLRASKTRACATYAQRLRGMRTLVLRRALEPAAAQTLR